MPPPDPPPPPAKRRRSEHPLEEANKECAFVSVSPCVVDNGTPSTSESLLSLHMNHTSGPLDIKPIREVPFPPAMWQPVIGRSRKESPVVVFAHGGGAPSTSIWMLKWKELIKEALDAVEVVTFDYPYILAKRKAPPKAEKLVDYHLKIVRDVSAKYPDHPLVLMGKSLGSRVSCMISGADGINVSAIVCFGYPLKGLKGELRDENLLQLRTPTLFVQGSNDCHCPLGTLELTRSKMSCRNEVYVVNGGDHSFQIGKKFQESSGMSQDQAERAAANAVAEFVFRCVRGG